MVLYGLKAKMLMCGVLIVGAVMAVCTSALADEYADRPEVQQFVGDMVTRHGFEKNYLYSLIRQAEKKQSILDAIARPAEKTKSWKEYRDIFLGQTRIEQGVKFWQRHELSLERAQREYGVDPQIIVAILGVETRYGRHRGGYRVLDALTTLGFDYPKRGKFFRQQLEEFLLMAREQKFDATTLMGSYAGAMGYGQFIPSSFRSFAVDFDEDGIVDIWNNPVDAIGSIANYFKRHQWRAGKPVCGRADVASNHNKAIANQSLKPSLSLGELKQHGYQSTEGFDANSKATVMRLEGDKGIEHWLGLHNFYVITRYNHSELYAMAVYQLSQEIEQQYRARVKNVSYTSK